MGANGPIEAQPFQGGLVAATGEITQGPAAWAIRPASIRVDKAGLLVWSDDGTGTINKIGYKP